MPLPTSSAALQNLTAVERLDPGARRSSACASTIASVDADQLLARFSTFDADETQPFGTSALQETLVPGFGRSLTTTTRNRRGEPHPRLRRLAC